MLMDVSGTVAASAQRRPAPTPAEDPSAWAAHESLYRLGAPNGFCELCGTSYPPGSDRRCRHCGCSETDTVLPTDDQTFQLRTSVFARERASDQREAEHQTIGIEEARRQRGLREEAALDALLAADPTLCPRCGNARPMPKKAQFASLGAAGDKVYADLVKKFAAEPCGYCRLVDQESSREGQSASEVEALLAVTRLYGKRQRATELAKPAAVREAETAAREEAAERRRLGVLPPNIPPLSPPIVLPCRSLLTDEKPIQGTTLQLFERGIAVGYPSGDAIFCFPWHQIASITVEAAETVQQRATLPRLAAGGVFALGFKKTFERCYVIITLNSGQEDIYEIPGRSTMQVRADLGPAIWWLDRYGDGVRAAAEVAPVVVELR
jgi:hypothetical protein